MLMNRKFAICLVVGSACSLGTAAWAQATSKPEPPKQEEKSKALSDADRKFIEDASQGNLSEIALGRLAVQRAQNDQVKTYGAKLVADHTKAEESLKALASKRDVKLPSKLDTSKTPLGRLESATTEKFDAEYLDNAIKDHEKDVAEFKHQAEAASDPELKSWVRHTLPVLEKHLSLAKDLEKKLKLREAPAMAP
jgi:putative membrane protein